MCQAWEAGHERQRGEIGPAIQVLLAQRTGQVVNEKGLYMIDWTQGSLADQEKGWVDDIN